MNGADALELLCSRAWPPLADEPLGDWRLRWADGFTGRANSALAVGDPGRPVPGALRAVCDFAHGHGVPPMAQAVRDGAAERAIAAAGWVPAAGHAAGHEVAVLTGPLPLPPRRPPRVAVRDEPDDGWWELTAGTREPSAAQRHVLTGGKVGYGVLEAGGVTAGAVRGALVDGWLHVARLAVRPAFRRRGFASALMTGLAAWGAEQGAHRWVLQVAEGNESALALYAGLGCVPHHRYRYWVPAPGTSSREEENSTS